MLGAEQSGMKQQGQPMGTGERGVGMATAVPVGNTPQFYQSTGSTEGGRGGGAMPQVTAVPVGTLYPTVGTADGFWEIEHLINNSSMNPNQPVVYGKESGGAQSATNDEMVSSLATMFPSQNVDMLKGVLKSCDGDFDSAVMILGALGNGNGNGNGNGVTVQALPLTESDSWSENGTPVAQVVSTGTGMGMAGTGMGMGTATVNPLTARLAMQDPRLDRRLSRSSSGGSGSGSGSFDGFPGLSSSTGTSNGNTESSKTTSSNSKNTTNASISGLWNRLSSSSSSTSSSSSFSRKLNKEQLEHLHNFGYVTVPGVVDKDLVMRAKRLINAELGKGVSPQEMEEAKKSALFKNLSTHKDIKNLFSKSEARSIVESALGKVPNQDGSMHFGQIALRFPGDMCGIDGKNSDNSFSIPPWWNKTWHIDGFGHRESEGGVKQLDNFNCLVGVLLNDLPEDFSGNLMVYPGSHNTICDYIRSHDVQIAMESGLDVIKESVEGDFNAPQQIKGKAGDIVICHWMLAHSIAPNCSGDIRHAVYFRVKGENFEEGVPPVQMNGLWEGWEGMAELENQ
eukprot:TRINITY_DN801_c2_g1_i1.p1 TRINITY_DN801_c2_g1~~TRINITY_DN801_c2_g1_i1.p1  ORF type:complete len:567 (-),score=146.07 TRINITY_DN801_c2_g1_i1:269-1969(-)